MSIIPSFIDDVCNYDLLTREIINTSRLKIKKYRSRKSESYPARKLVHGKILTKSGQLLARNLVNKLRRKNYVFSIPKILFQPKLKNPSNKYTHDEAKRLLKLNDPKFLEEYRPVSIPPLHDIIVQKRILNELRKILDPGFSTNSFAYRSDNKNFNCSTAVKKMSLLRSRYKFVAKIDIKRFFDEIDHEILKFILREKLEKLRIKTQVIDFILEIISNFLKITPKMKGHDSKGHPYEFKGIPQGGPLSTLVSNLYLDVLDKEFHRNNVEFIRYADDIIIFSESREIARNNLNIYELFLKNNLCLNVGSKNNVHSFEEGFDYLGFHFKNKSKLIREKTIEKFKDKIRQITIRKNKKRILFSKLNRYIKTINMVIGFIPKREKGQPKKNLFVPKYAWAKYFCLAYEPNDLILKQLKDLDCFIRDRLRRLYCLMFNKSIDFKKQDKSKTLFINKTNRKFKHNGLKTLEESFFRLKRD